MMMFILNQNLSWMVVDVRAKHSHSIAFHLCILRTTTTWPGAFRLKFVNFYLTQQLFRLSRNGKPWHKEMFIGHTEYSLVSGSKTCK